MRQSSACMGLSGPRGCREDRLLAILDLQLVRLKGRRAELFFLRCIK